MAKQNTYALATPALGDKVFIVDVSDTGVDANGASKNVLISALKTLVNTSPTLSDPTFTGGPIEEIYALSGTSATLEPDNGSVQTHTLSGNTTYTDSFTSGQGMFLIIYSASAYTVTFPTVTWLNNGGSAPTINSSGYTTLSFIKSGSTLFGLVAGDQS